MASQLRGLHSPPSREQVKWTTFVNLNCDVCWPVKTGSQSSGFLAFGPAVQSPTKEETRPTLESCWRSLKGAEERRHWQHSSARGTQKLSTCSCHKTTKLLKIFWPVVFQDIVKDATIQKTPCVYERMRIESFSGIIWGGRGGVTPCRWMFHMQQLSLKDASTFANEERV